jgi:hypothetical protein
MMNDWTITHATGTEFDPVYHGEAWVYYENRNFPGLHISRSVEDPHHDHVGINNTNHYYFGFTKSYSPSTPAGEHQRLSNAWSDYFRVR